MKPLLILAFAICSASTFGQAPSNKISGVTIYSSKELEKDTSLKVIYVNKEKLINKPAYFLNKKFVNGTLLSTLNPRLIENISVSNDNIQVDSILYYGRIDIKTKSSYNPKLISLTGLKDKYTDLKNKSVVFMIDGGIINADYNKYMVDESYLLTIIVDKIENSKENIFIGLIKLLTRSDENIKKSKEIRIRGAEVAINK